MYTQNNCKWYWVFSGIAATIFGTIYWFLLYQLASGTIYESPTGRLHYFIGEAVWRKYVFSSVPMIGTVRVFHTLAIIEDCEGKNPWHFARTPMWPKLIYSCSENHN